MLVGKIVCKKLFALLCVKSIVPKLIWWGINFAVCLSTAILKISPVCTCMYGDTMCNDYQYLGYVVYCSLSLLDDDDAQDFTAATSRASRFSIKTVMKTSTPKKKFASTIEQPPRPSSARVKKYSQELSHDHAHHSSMARRHSDERSDSFGSLYSGSDQSRAVVRRQYNRSPKPRPRKIAQVQRFSDFEVIDDESLIEQLASPKQRQRTEVGSTPSLYTIFQNILEVLCTDMCVCGGGGGWGGRGGIEFLGQK